MSPRTKKLIGTIIILMWIPVYALFIVGLSGHLPAKWYVELLFYPLAGLLWAVPVGALFPWMMREPKPRT